ncbi:SNF2 family N-terminal domain-containing protein [Paraphysoderma sedebokerense]|nr:SNF2 family N-terminal domain-containing protein [Paraphysoderma sedebokerense]
MPEPTAMDVDATPVNDANPQLINPPVDNVKTEETPDDMHDQQLPMSEDVKDEDGTKTVEKGRKRSEKVAERRAQKDQQNAILSEKRKALDKTKAADTLKRYSYLLGQTEIFQHFIHDDVRDLLRSPEPKSSKDGSRRHRKTEKEEDQEMLAGDTETDITTVFTESPSYVTGGTLRDYQLAGLNWMISLFQNGVNGILADEMGLGKTLQTISFLGYLKYYRDMPGPHLVIVPKSTLHNWVNEFNKWVPDFDVFMFHGSKDDRAEIVKNVLIPQKFEVCITSYEICLLEKAHFRKISWGYIVIDEAHRIKNENSQLSQIVRLFDCKNRLLLTGTPLQNNLHELWALLNFLLPDVFSSSEDFDKWFSEGDQDKVQQLHKVLRPFLLRRIKADVEKSLLPKKKVNVYVGMSSMQKKWYQKILEKNIDAVNGAIGKKESKTRLLNIVMQLRKCCNHPYLFEGAEPGPPYTTDQHIVDNAGKMVVLDKLLGRMKERGSRVLLFSQMSRMLDIMEDYCLWKGYEYCRIDGQTAHEDRINAIEEYNKPDSSKFIFLLTTRAGGLGINLTTADIVVLYDNDWNPQVDLQAEDRAHRIGQTKQVVVYRFVTENAIDEKVIERATQKLQLDKMVIQNGRLQSQSKETGDDYLAMIRHGAEQVFNDTESGIGDIDADIDDILKKGEEKTAQLVAKYQNAQIQDLLRLEGSAYEWDGEDYRQKKQKNIALNWIEPTKRDRKVNYGIDEYYRGVMRTGGRKEASNKAPKPPKFVQLYDFQFFPMRLYELQEQEILAYRKQVGYKVPKRTPAADEEIDDEELEKEQQQEQARIDEAEPLTEEETAEKEQLMTQGFGNWGKREFGQFVKCCEAYGRNNFEQFSSNLPTKTVDEIKQYSTVFWERYKEIDDWKKIIDTIEKGEKRLSRVQEVQETLTARISELRSPLSGLKIPYNTSAKGKNYTEEEDRFLLVTLEKYGYGSEDVYDRMRDEIRTSPLFRFDWFLRSRTSQELSRRCNTLVSLLTKENAADDEDGRKRKRANGDDKVSR